MPLWNFLYFFYFILRVCKRLYSCTRTPQAYFAVDYNALTYCLEIPLNPSCIRGRREEWQISCWVYCELMISGLFWVGVGGWLNTWKPFCIVLLLLNVYCGTRTSCLFQSAFHFSCGNTLIKCVIDSWRLINDLVSRGMTRTTDTRSCHEYLSFSALLLDTL